MFDIVMLRIEGTRPDNSGSLEIDDDSDTDDVIGSI
jgi:hypothetical protein